MEKTMFRKYILFVLLASSQISAESTLKVQDPVQKPLTHGQKVVIYGAVLGGAVLIAKGVGSLVYPLLPSSLSLVAKRRIVMGIGGCVGFIVVPGEKQMDKIMDFFEKHRNWLFF